MSIPASKMSGYTIPASIPDSQSGVSQADHKGTPVHLMHPEELDEKLTALTNNEVNWRTQALLIESPYNSVANIVRAYAKTMERLDPEEKTKAYRLLFDLFLQLRDMCHPEHQDVLEYTLDEQGLILTLKDGHSQVFFLAAFASLLPEGTLKEFAGMALIHRCAEASAKADDRTLQQEKVKQKLQDIETAQDGEVSRLCLDLVSELPFELRSAVEMSLSDNVLYDLGHNSWLEVKINDIIIAERLLTQPDDIDLARKCMGCLMLMKSDDTTTPQSFWQTITDLESGSTIAEKVTVWETLSTKLPPKLQYNIFTRLLEDDKGNNYECLFMFDGVEFRGLRHPLTYYDASTSLPTLTNEFLEYLQARSAFWTDKDNRELNDKVTQRLEKLRADIENAKTTADVLRAKESLKWRHEDAGTIGKYDELKPALDNLHIALTQKKDQLEAQAAAKQQAQIEAERNQAQLACIRTAVERTFLKEYMHLHRVHKK